MRLSYLAQDRPDIQFSCKEVAKGMLAPTEGDWQKLKRLGRYLVGKPRVILYKSTNGGALTFGKHCAKSWSTTQSVIALSSGEAEYYGIVKGGSVLLGAISTARDLGIETKGQIHTGSTAAKGIANRRGLGRTRHIHVNYFWIQERVSSGDFTVHKVPTDDNPVDLFTKYLDQSKLDKLAKFLSYAFLDGKSHLTLTAAN